MLKATKKFTLSVGKLYIEMNYYLGYCCGLTNG